MLRGCAMMRCLVGHFVLKNSWNSSLSYAPSSPFSGSVEATVVESMFWLRISCTLQYSSAETLGRCFTDLRSGLSAFLLVGQRCFCGSTCFRRGDAIVARWVEPKNRGGGSMVKAVRVHTVGGRHRLQLEEVELPHPGCNEVEVRHRAIGLNYPDVEDCKGGGHHVRHSIFTPGSSAVGVITELGTGVLNHQIGQRVGYVNPPNKGAFSEASILPTTCLVPIPSSITDEEAAALLFPGFTAWMVLKKLNPIQPGDTILVHNVASGLGSIIAQWAKHLEAFVIGTVFSENDVERAEMNGCSEVVVIKADSCDFADEVRELTGGEGVAFVFDLVGKSTFMASLDCLAVKGMLVYLGAPGGDAPILNFKDLAGKGSLMVAVPVLGDYVKHQEELLEGAQLLFELHKAGEIKAEIAKKFSLNTISKEMDAMTKGEAVGLCILIPPVPDPKNYYSRSS